VQREPAMSESTPPSGTGPPDPGQPYRQDDAPAAPRRPTVSAKAWGALAVLGVVVAFSLSSTLVKRAESPGVLVAFWRMATVSVGWNFYLWSTGRRVTLRHLRQALVPGVFFGLNLAAFFAGATHNSVANAALIGSLSPFLIVPLGARMFREYHNPRALVFALVAFGGVALVLFSAPPHGDASIRGNAFGILAMFLWTGYVVSTRHFRRDMDVATFMATVSPIGAVAILPLAIANAGMFGMSRTGWTYTLILALLTGVTAQGLMVFAQKTIQIGTIGITQVVQPALAVVWSFLLLGETLRNGQVAGIAIVMSGLLAFLVLNQRGSLTRLAAGRGQIVTRSEATT
jgi:drug/metabolite transporter (DMT)-like permease